MPGFERPGAVATRPERFDVRERLRQLIRQIETRPAPSPAPRGTRAPAASLRSTRPTVAPLDGAVRRETASGPMTYREEPFVVDEYLVGTQPLASLRHVGADELRVLSSDLEHSGTDAQALERLLFLDIETTGLGGAGAMVFLVAMAHIEGGTLRMRQYLAETPAEEGALLDALLEDIAASVDDPILVTYNGRTFDAPMLDGRATLHRKRAGFESLPHLDALGPARALYRGWLPSCRLAEVEARILGVTRPSADVDGAEVPAWYFRFLRSGDMRFVEPIASHNLLDVLSLAALTGRLASLLRGGEEPRGAEGLGLGRLLARRDPHRAIAALQQAEATPGTAGDRREVLWLLGRLQKRHGFHEEAVPLWRELAGDPGAWSLRAHEELAKFYEHRAGDLPQAALVVERALRELGGSAVVDERSRGAFRHRLERLTSRMNRARRGA